MREMVKRVTTGELYKLMDVTLDSESVTDIQAGLLCDIMDELMERGEMQTFSDEELIDSHLRLIGKAEELKDLLVKHKIPVNAMRAKSKTRRKRFRFTLVAASVAVALFLTHAVTLAAGFDLFGTMAQWSKDAVYFVFGGGDNSEERVKPPDTDAAYVPLYRALETLGIQIDLPKYIPSGYRFDTIEPDTFYEYDELSSVRAWFARGDDKFSIAITQIMSDSILISELDGKEHSEMYGGRYLVAPNISRMKALWFDGMYIIQIQGDLTYEELTQILDSI